MMYVAVILTLLVILTIAITLYTLVTLNQPEQARLPIRLRDGKQHTVRRRY
ncbi:MAG: hypothetical protein HC911_15325 [Chloroflexaceae bacterium]|nr:hypothetical protein [Chloroflexaceae bacterium]